MTHPLFPKNFPNPASLLNKIFAHNDFSSVRSKTFVSSIFKEPILSTNVLQSKLYNSLDKHNRDNYKI